MKRIYRFALGIVGSLVISAGLMFMTGCVSPSAREADRIQDATPVPFGPAAARITVVNDEYRFVVLDFSDRSMPRLGTELNVYRGEQKVGRVRLTEPVRARFATADVLEGTVRVGDEAR
ncbi:hypothetical protein HQ590_11385 [bacterium]|nr:hypothetical protein [bacterium]